MRSPSSNRNPTKKRKDRDESESKIFLFPHFLLMITQKQRGLSITDSFNLSYLGI
jgi:hypothetical protein